jgi:MFS transporter, ACS family, tartrate transporter
MTTGASAAKGEQLDSRTLDSRTRRRVTARLMPFLFALYMIAYIDRINISFAGLQMTGELGFTDAVFGFGSGVFFFGYTLLAIPGAMLVEGWSARKTIAATMAFWGLVASATGFIRTPHEFYAMRLLLGVAEAAFFPGMITYLSHWYRSEDRAKAVAMFMTAIPVSRVIASPISAALLNVRWMGLGGWRWLLILEGAPAIVFGVASLLYLTDRPDGARWLSQEERDWLCGELRREAVGKQHGERKPLLAALRRLDVWLLCLAYFGGTTGEYGLSLWLPKILQRMGNLTVAKTALLTAIPSLAAIPAMLLWGWSSDRSRERRWHAAIPRMIAGISLGAIAYQAFRSTGGPSRVFPCDGGHFRGLWTSMGDARRVFGIERRRGQHRIDQRVWQSGRLRRAVGDRLVQLDERLRRRTVGRGRGADRFGSVRSVGAKAGNKPLPCGRGSA